MLKMENVFVFKNMEDCVKHFVRIIRNLDVSPNVKRVYEFNVVDLLDKINNRQNENDTILNTTYILNDDCFYIVSSLKFNRFKVEKLYIDDDFSFSFFDKDVQYFDDLYNALGYCHN